MAKNRQRLLDAAKEVFAERGLSATLDDVARRAGVGAGTAYRHFGSRSEIVSEIFSDVTATFAADARAALDVSDAWEGLRGFVEAFAARQAADRALHQVFAGGHGHALDPAGWAALVEAVSALLDRAKGAGVVRDDVEFSDLVGLFVSMGPLYDLSSAAGAPVWRRHVDLCLRGVQRGSAPTGVTVPVALTAEAVTAVMVRPAPDPR